jgi:hypothetical protein
VFTHLWHKFVVVEISLDLGTAAIVWEVTLPMNSGLATNKNTFAVKHAAQSPLLRHAVPLNGQTSRVVEAGRRLRLK